MHCVYLAHVDWRTHAGTPRHPTDDAGILSLGLRCRWQWENTRLYAPAGASVLDLAHAGAVVGELYLRSGEPVGSRSQLPDMLSVATLRAYILSMCWGEFVLLQPVPGVPDALEVLRSPSHACEVPCLYSSTHAGAFVTSDIGMAVAARLYRRQVDDRNLLHRLVYPNIKTAATTLAGITELLPGHSLALRRAGLRVDRHWNPWVFATAGMRYRHVDEAIVAVHDAVQTTGSALAGRDQSVLIELSGGLDSSIVAASLTNSGARLHCTTMMSALPGADEREYAAAVADTLGTGLMETELRVEDAAFEFQLPPQLASPSVGLLQYGIDTLMQASAVRFGAKSAFCGAGGDSVFGFLTNAAPVSDALRTSGPKGCLHAIHDLATFHQCTYWKVSRLALGKLLRPYPHHATDLSFVAADIAPPDLQLHPWMEHPDDALAGDVQRIYELGGTQVFQDSCPRRWARPLRMPLLSQPVIEACLRVPSWMWFTGGQNRAIARMAFAGQLPPRIISRRSKGTLTAHLGSIYRRKKRQMVHFLIDGELQARGLLDANALMQLQADERDQHERVFLRMFHFCMVENWLRQQARLM